MMANAGVTKETRMTLTDHKSNEHDRYTHLELDTLREAVSKLPRFKPQPVED